MVTSLIGKQEATQIEPESTQIRRGSAGLETTAQVTGQPKDTDSVLVDYRKTQ